MRGHLPKKTLLLWEIRIFILLILPAAAAGIAAAYIGFLIWIFAFLCVALLVLELWYIPKLFKSFEIYADCESVRISYGVIIKTSHIMPYPRLIFAQTFQTPLAKRLSLSALSLKAARTALFIPEIEEKDAEALVNTVAGEKSDEE